MSLREQKGIPRQEAAECFLRFSEKRTKKRSCFGFFVKKLALFRFVYKKFTKK